MRRFFANILYLFLGLPLAFSALFLCSIRPWVLDRDFYASALADKRLSALVRSPELAREAEPRLVLGDTVFFGPALVAAAQASFPEAELVAAGKSIVNLNLDALEGKPVPPAGVDLRPLKKALLAAAPKAGNAYAAALPTTATALPAGDYSARPEGLSVARSGAAAGTALATAIGGLPDNLPVKIKLPAEPGMPAAISQASLNQYALSTSLLASALLMALAFVGGGGIWASLTRAGKMLGLPSVIVLALGAALALPGASFVERLLPPEVRQLVTSGSQAELRAWAASFLGPISKGFFLTGLVGASAAGLLSSLKRIGKPEES